MNNIKFDEVEFPRYIKVKESIEELIKIIDYEEVKKDGVDRILSALLQLIDESDDKTVEEKRYIIEDAIYNGNVFRHYFNEENQAEAVDVLSNTVLLNDEERLIYIINFYMPNDIDFTGVYKNFDKDLEKIAEHYELTHEDARNFIYARAAEISKFYKMYQEEKERQRLFNETQALATMQDALEIPSEENIKKAKALIDKLTNVELKTTLLQQLSELNNGYIEEILKEPFVPGESIGDENSEQSEKLESTVVVQTAGTQKPGDDRLARVVEPRMLAEVLERGESNITESKLGEEVMQSLQAFVSGAKENADKVAQLSLELDEKSEQIKKLELEITQKDQEIGAKDQKLREKARTLEEGNAKIRALEGELALNENQLEEAERTIATKGEEIEDLNRRLCACQEYLVQIQTCLNVAQAGITVSEDTRQK